MKLERSNQVGKFTDSEIRGFLAESKKRQSAPGYAAAEAKRQAEARSKCSKGTKFPTLAKRGTKPALVGEHHSVANARRRIDIISRKI